MNYINPINETAEKAALAINAEDFFGVKLPSQSDKHFLGTESINGRKVYWWTHNTIYTLNMMVAGQLAYQIGVPVSPSIYKRIDDDLCPHKVFSLGCFDFPILKIKAGIRHPREEERFLDVTSKDVATWINRFGPLPQMPDAELDWILFKSCNRHLSALLPYFALIGHADKGSQNEIIDGKQLRELVLNRDSGQKNQNLDMYAIDCFVGGESELEKCRMPHFNDEYASCMGGFETVMSAPLIANPNYGLTEEEDDFLDQCARDLSCELFSSYIDRGVFDEIAGRIMNFSNSSLEDVINNVARTVGRGLPRDQAQIVQTHSQKIFEFLRDRRDRLPEYLQTFPSDVSQTVADPDFNPFTIFQNEFDKRLLQPTHAVPRDEKTLKM